MSPGHYRSGEIKGGERFMAKVGLAAATAETRQRVASAGGKASHGGGRPTKKKKRAGVKK